MNNISKVLRTVLYSTAFLALMLGCRRPLVDKKSDTALVPIHIDWSKSSLDVATMKQASVWFFPQNGGAVIEHRLKKEISLSDAVVELAVGRYSIVVFNEAIDGTESLVFTGQDRYETFYVSTTDAVSPQSAGPTRATPDALASWSLGQFEVTLDMVVRTRTQSKATVAPNLAGYMLTKASSDAVDQELSAVQSITPLPRTRLIKVEAYVHNLVSATNVSCYLSGATGVISLATGKPILGLVQHTLPMSLDQATMDQNNPKNGRLNTSILVFDHQDAPTYGIGLDFLLTNNSTVNNEFKVDQVIEKEELVIEIKVGKDPEEVNPDPEKPKPEIKLPDPIGNDAELEDWEKHPVEL